MALRKQKNLLNAYVKLFPKPRKIPFCSCKVPPLKKDHEQVLDYFNLGYFFSPAINNAGGLLIVNQKTKPSKLLNQDENYQILQIVNGSTKIVNFYCRAKSFQTRILQACWNMRKQVPKKKMKLFFFVISTHFSAKNIPAAKKS